MPQHWMPQKCLQINYLFGTEDKSLNSALYIRHSALQSLNNEEKKVYIFLMWYFAFGKLLGGYWFNIDQMEMGRLKLVHFPAS